MKISKLMLVDLAICTLIAVIYLPMTFASEKQLKNSQNHSLLSEPFLQIPTKTSVNIVWFTDFQGNAPHLVKYGKDLTQQVTANTTKLSRVREDQDSYVDNPPGEITLASTFGGNLQQRDFSRRGNHLLRRRYAFGSSASANAESRAQTTPTQSTPRDIWRHEATITGLIPNQRLPYQVVSIKGQEIIASKVFTLASQPSTDSKLKILLTSDHQLMPMTTANLAKVVETIDQIDAVFFAGDLVNIPDRASEWFDDHRGGAFFPSLQGRANYELERDGIKTTYQGGEIIQHAPLFTTLGNHEVMGRFASANTLKEEFENSRPRQVATEFYQQIASKINPTKDTQLQQDWIKNNSFNTDTYEEIFSLPESSTGGKRYYATTFGDIRLISLYVTNIWRSPSLEAEAKGRYKESEKDLDNPEAWGYGQHLFEAIAKGSPQYKWLEQELQSEAYQQAKYKIVMLHHPPHTLGGNIVPPYTDPQPKLDYTETGKLRSRYYDYPIEDDYIIRDLIPLLESAGVQLVYYGHSHLWNRFQSPGGMHFLESSNVGNSYGAHLGDNKRPVPAYSPENYKVTGDPNGLEPIIPNIAPLVDQSGQPLAYIASNDITVFSIFDTQTGTVSSYRYDTRKPNSAVVKFDEFKL